MGDLHPCLSAAMAPAQKSEIKAVQAAPPIRLKDRSREYVIPADAHWTMKLGVVGSHLLLGLAPYGLVFVLFSAGHWGTGAAVAGAEAVVRWLFPTRR